MMGRVKVWDPERFFGFVENEGGRWFFHGTRVLGQVWQGDTVQFELTENERRRELMAVDVQRHNGGI